MPLQFGWVPLAALKGILHSEFSSMITFARAQAIVLSAPEFLGQSFGFVLAVLDTSMANVSNHSPRLAKWTSKWNSGSTLPFR